MEENKKYSLFVKAPQHADTSEDFTQIWSSMPQLIDLVQSSIYVGFIETYDFIHGGYSLPLKFIQ